MKIVSRKILGTSMAAMAMVAGAYAQTVALWGFDSGESSAERLAASNAMPDVVVSALIPNTLDGYGFRDFGPGAVPNDEHDGFGFGGNGGQQVMFLHRANYFDASAVTNPRPSELDYTSFDFGQGTGAALGNGNAPFSFTVENNSATDLNLIGVKAALANDGATLLFAVQEAGAAQGADVPVTAPYGENTAYLRGGGLIVGSGQTKTLTISLNSGALNSGHTVHYFELLSGVAPEITTFAIAQPSPGINDADIAQINAVGGFGSDGIDALWGNQPAQGTTFTTGNSPAGYTLRSFSMRMGKNSYNYPTTATFPWKARVGKVTASTMTEVVRAYESASAFGNWTTNGNDWCTLTFATPVHLEPNTLYGADFGCNGGFGGSPTRVSNSYYAGGQSYRSGTGGTGTNTLTFTGHDRVFHLDMTTVPLPDPSIQVEGNYNFGRLYHAMATNSTSRTVTYQNVGLSRSITINSVALTDTAAGIFTITAAPANGTVVPAGGSFDVTITATGGNGYNDYIGALVIDTSHSGNAGDLDQYAAPQAEIIANGDAFIMVNNPKLDNSLTGWNGDALMTQGLVSQNGARVRGAGEPVPSSSSNNLSQAFTYWLSPDFDLSVYFALPDWTELGLVADAANYDRAFHLAVQSSPVLPGDGDFDNGDTLKTIINLFYFPNGAGSSTAAGFYLYDGEANSFTHLAALGTVTASTGITTNSPLPSNLMVYQLTINGRGFGTPAASYSVSISDPNDTTIAATVSGLTTYHGVSPADATAKAVVFTTTDMGESDTNPLNALQSSFWVDDVKVALLETIPLALYHQATPPGMPKTLVGGTRSLSFSVQNVGLGSDLAITSSSFGTSEFSLLSPALPVNLAPGASQTFVVSGRSIMPGLTSDMLAFAASDPVTPAPAVAVAINGFTATTVELVDYNDGIANGIHEDSIRNGGLEEGPVGTSATGTTGWTLRTGVGTKEDNGTALVYDAAPATGTQHGRINNWQNPLSYAAGFRISADEWTLDAGDTFTVELKWRGAENYDAVTDSLHFWLNGVNAFGGEMPRFGTVSHYNTNSNPLVYETFTFTTAPIPAGSGLIGNGFELQFSLTSPGEHWYYIDDISVTANMTPVGAVSTDLEITGLGFEPSSQDVTMRWYNTGAKASAYTIKSIGDLQYPGVPNEFVLDGSQNYTAYPGEIEYTFNDPAATGAKKFYWLEMN